MNHPYKCPQKVVYPIFYILSGCHFIEENSLHFPLFPFFEGISLNEVATAQNIENRVNNFLGTLMDDSCQISDLYDDVAKC